MFQSKCLTWGQLNITLVRCVCVECWYFVRLMYECLCICMYVHEEPLNNEIEWVFTFAQQSSRSDSVWQHVMREKHACFLLSYFFYHFHPFCHVMPPRADVDFKSFQALTLHVMIPVYTLVNPFSWKSWCSAQSILLISVD